MKNLLKADFYRLFRSKSFYILIGVVFLAALMNFALYFALINVAEDDFMGISMTAEEFQKLCFDGTLGYCAAIVAALFICGDYSSGGIRNKILTGSGRKNIFCSKLIVIVFVSVCAYVASQVVVFVLGGLGFGWEGVSAADVAFRFITGLMLAAAYGAIFTAIPMLYEKLSVSLAVSIVLLFALSLIMGLLTVGQIYIHSAVFDWFVKVFGWLTPAGQTTLLMSGSKDFWVMCLFSLAWVLAVFFLFPLLFKKREVK